MLSAAVLYRACSNSDREIGGATRDHEGAVGRRCSCVPSMNAINKNALLFSSFFLRRRFVCGSAWLTEAAQHFVVARSSSCSANAWSRGVHPWHITTKRLRTSQWYTRLA